MRVKMAVDKSFSRATNQLSKQTKLSWRKRLARRAQRRALKQGDTWRGHSSKHVI